MRNAYLLTCAPNEDSNHMRISRLCPKSSREENLHPVNSGTDTTIRTIPIQNAPSKDSFQDYANAQADLNFLWAQYSKVRFLTLRLKLNTKKMPGTLSLHYLHTQLWPCMWEWLHKKSCILIVWEYYVTFSLVVFILTVPIRFFFFRMSYFCAMVRLYFITKTHIFKYTENFTTK